MRSQRYFNLVQLKNPKAWGGIRGISPKNVLHRQNGWNETPTHDKEFYASADDAWFVTHTPAEPFEFGVNEEDDSYDPNYTPGEQRYNKGVVSSVWKSSGTTKSAGWKANFEDGNLYIQYVDVSLKM